jgi:small redox-active disulfide protein 2
MKQFKVLGSGCKNCTITAEKITAKAAELNIEISIEKITDITEIMGLGVMTTPGVVVDDQVVHSGGIPSSDSITDWLRS